MLIFFVLSFIVFYSDVYYVILDSAKVVNGSTMLVLAWHKRQGSRGSGIVQLADYYHNVNDESLNQLNYTLK